MGSFMSPPAPDAVTFVCMISAISLCIDCTLARVGVMSPTRVERLQPLAHAGRNLRVRTGDRLQPMAMWAGLALAQQEGQTKPDEAQDSQDLHHREIAAGIACAG